MRSSRLLLLDNSLDHAFYRPVDHWSELLGFTPDQVHVPSGAPLPEPGEHDRVILSGCEGSILDAPQWAEPEIAWVREAADRGVRMLGSCWGHQLLAWALGSPNCVRRAANPELGWTHVALEHRAGPFTESFDSFVSHFDEVIAGSHPDMRVLARSKGCEAQVVRWGERPIWGLQAHPEITPTTGRSFLEAGLARWPAHEAAFRDALEQPVRDSGFGRRLAALWIG